MRGAFPPRVQSLWGDQMGTQGATDMVLEQVWAGKARLRGQVHGQAAVGGPHSRLVEGASGELHVPHFRGRRCWEMGALPPAAHSALGERRLGMGTAGATPLPLLGAVI